MPTHHKQRDKQNRQENQTEFQSARASIGRNAQKALYEIHFFLPLSWRKPRQPIVRRIPGMSVSSKRTERVDYRQSPVLEHSQFIVRRKRNRL